MLRLRRPRKRFEKPRDRKSTRLNSSHSSISYAVFCLKKKGSGRGQRVGHGGGHHTVKQQPARAGHGLLITACVSFPPPPSLSSPGISPFFFFKASGAPRILPSSPPAGSPV